MNYIIRYIKFKLNFIITIPIWDIQGKNKMKSINSKNNELHKIWGYENNK